MTVRLLQSAWRFSRNELSGKAGAVQIMSNPHRLPNLRAPAGRPHQRRQDPRHPVPSVVMKFLQIYIDLALAPQVGEVIGDTPLFWSRWPARKGVRRVMPIHGKNIWRLCKTGVSARRTGASSAYPG